MTKQSIVIIYHANCPDGFGAAWAAWKKFGKKAIYIPQEHHAPPPENITGSDVYILDFCFGKDVIRDMLKKVRSLTIIGRHVTAKDIVESVPNHSFAINNSGAVLTWEYLHGSKPYGKKIPKLLLYVEDVDIWKFKLKNTREIISALSVYGMDFKVWDKLAKDMERSGVRKGIIDQGRAILKFKQRIIEEMVLGAERVEFEGYESLVSSCPTTIHSELGNALVKKLPPLGIVYRKKGDQLKVSLRSDGTVDVSKIAQKYGGGGHKAAAGFQISANKPYPWKTK